MGWETTKRDILSGKPTRLHTKAMEVAKKGNLKGENKLFLIAVHNNATRTSYSKVKIDYTQQNSKCSLCGERDETVNYMISECSKLS